MNVPEYLSSLRARDIVIDAEQNNLKINAPKGAVTLEIQNTLRENKAQILAHLLSQKTVQARASIPRADRDQPIPASSAQRGLWFQYRLEGLSSTYNIPMVYSLPGPIDLPLLEKSFQRW